MDKVPSTVEPVGTYILSEVLGNIDDVAINEIPFTSNELEPTDAIKKSGIQLGVIAQELQPILPDCVKTESTGVMSVDTDNLTWYLINAVKELKAEFDAYKATHP